MPPPRPVASPVTTGSLITSTSGRLSSASSAAGVVARAPSPPPSDALAPDVGSRGPERTSSAWRRGSPGRTGAVIVAVAVPSSATRGERARVSGNAPSVGADDAIFSARVKFGADLAARTIFLAGVRSHAERTRPFWAFNMIRAMLSLALIFRGERSRVIPIRFINPPDTAAVPLHDYPNVSRGYSNVPLTSPALPVHYPGHRYRPCGGRVHRSGHLRGPRSPRRGQARRSVLPRRRSRVPSAATIPSAEGTRSTSGSSPGAGPRASAGPPGGCAVSRSAT